MSKILESGFESVAITLPPKLLSGEVSVSAAEEIVAEAT